MLVLATLLHDVHRLQPLQQLQQLQQAAGPDTSLRDIAVYVADVAAISACGFAWRTNAAIVELRTLLQADEIGVIARLTRSTNQGHRHANTLQEHEGRLDSHDRELDRLDREKEPRRALQPQDVGKPDRRGTS